MEKKGEVLDKVYTRSIPTVVIWDGDVSIARSHIDRADKGENDSDDDNVWDTLENVGDSDREDVPRNTKWNMKGRVE